MYWDFDCKIGATSDIAQVIPYEELIKALDKIKSMGVSEVYVEVIAREVVKPIKEAVEAPQDENE